MSSFEMGGVGPRLVMSRQTWLKADELEWPSRFAEGQAELGVGELVRVGCERFMLEAAEWRSARFVVPGVPAAAGATRAGSVACGRHAPPAPPSQTANQMRASEEHLDGIWCRRYINSVEIFGTDEFDAWYLRLDEAEQEAVDAVVEKLGVAGVRLPFPHSSGIAGTESGG